jgi:hypothetical protein
MPERLTKVFVGVSMTAAAAVLTIVAGHGFPTVRLLSVLGFAGGVALGRRRPEVASTVVLAFTYLVPGLYLAAGRHYYPFLIVPWISALLGLILSSVRHDRWHFPDRWKLPLAFWAVVVAASWPLVVLRELDFTPALYGRDDLFNNGSALSTRIAAGWVTTVGLAHGVGLLWLDWLFATFRATEAVSFRARVVYPLGASWGLTALVAAGQTFVDPRFLNTPFWAELRRVPGALYDANAFGILSGIWGPTLVATALTWRSRRGLALAAAALSLGAVGILGSGSRSAMLIAVVALAGAAWSVARGRHAVAIGSRAALVASATAVVVGLAWWLFTPGVATPVSRMVPGLPELTPAALGSFLVALWTRDVFGTVADRLIASFPLSGIGLGTFHIVVADFGHLFSGIRLPFDNAQNWYRHQLVELGVLGSLGWITWLFLFLRDQLVRSRAVEIDAVVLKALVVGFGIASVVGVHAQEAPILITCWTIVFWLTLSVRADATPALHAGCGPSPRWWAVSLVAAAIHLVSVGYVAVESLRVPRRAAIADWRYAYGFHVAEQLPGIGELRWTQGKAVAVLRPREASSITLRIAHPDAGRRPIRVRIWRDQDLVIDELFRDERPVTRPFTGPSPGTGVVMTIHVSRTWRPSDHGRPDPRTLGVGVSGPLFSGL